MYLRRIRWSREVISELANAGANVSKINIKTLLRAINSITLSEPEGIPYLKQFFEMLFDTLGIDYRLHSSLREHHDSFFQSSQDRIDRLIKEGADFISNISSFRRVFKPREGITVSTIHGVKGGEYDAVIAFALLEDMVPHFSDSNGQVNARKMLYVISSRARKNLHLISECDRPQGNWGTYKATYQLVNCIYDYDSV